MQALQALKSLLLARISNSSWDCHLRICSLCIAQRHPANGTKGSQDPAQAPLAKSCTHRAASFRGGAFFKLAQRLPISNQLGSESNNSSIAASQKKRFLVFHKLIILEYSIDIHNLSHHFKIICFQIFRPFKMSSKSSEIGCTANFGKSQTGSLNGFPFSSWDCTFLLVRTVHYQVLGK